MNATSDAFLRDNAAGTESFVSYQGICDLVGQAVGKPARTQGYDPKDFELPKVRITMLVRASETLVPCRAVVLMLSNSAVVPSNADA